VEVRRKPLKERDAIDGKRPADRELDRP